MTAASRSGSTGCIALRRALSLRARRPSRSSLLGFCAGRWALAGSWALAREAVPRPDGRLLAHPRRRRSRGARDRGRRPPGAPPSSPANTRLIQLGQRLQPAMVEPAPGAGRGAGGARAGRRRWTGAAPGSPFRDAGLPPGAPPGVEVETPEAARAARPGHRCCLRPLRTAPASSCASWGWPAACLSVLVDDTGAPVGAAGASTTRTSLARGPDHSASSSGQVGSRLTRRSL